MVAQNRTFIMNVMNYREFSNKAFKPSADEAEILSKISDILVKM